MAKIELVNVRYVYAPGTPFETCALDDVTIGIREDALTGIIGHTGSGKSTMVQLFNGLRKPTAGRILLDGVDIWEKPKEIQKIRFRVGLVMQYPEYQLFEETVRADIAYGPKNMKLPPEEVERRVLQAAELTGLTPDVLDRSPFELSGGQKRRVAIAGIIAMQPEVLVLDEPAAGLDPAGRNTILTLMRDYQRKTHATVIIVSHSMEDMAVTCDELVVLSSAKVVMQGTAKEVFSHEDVLTDIGLDLPEVARVCNALRKRGVPLPAGIFTVEEAAACLFEQWNTDNRATVQPIVEKGV